MLRHSTTLDWAQTIKINITTTRVASMKWDHTTMPTRGSHASETDAAAFDNYKRSLHSTLIAVEVLTVALREITIDGPDPSAVANVNAANREAFEAANSLVHHLISRTFTGDNSGHYLASTAAPNDGAQLYDIVMAHHERMDEDN